MPLSLLEAMASGLPAVTTETCGMMDVVEHGYNGLLAKPADGDGFASRVRELIESAELRERLGRKAQETMRRHTWDRIAASLEQVFVAAACSGSAPETQLADIPPAAADNRLKPQ